MSTSAKKDSMENMLLKTELFMQSMKITYDHFYIYKDPWKLFFENIT